MLGPTLDSTVQEGHECTEMSSTKDYEDDEKLGESELYREAWRAGLFSLEKSQRGLLRVYLLGE